MELFQNPALIQGVQFEKDAKTLICTVNNNEVFRIELDTLEKTQELGSITKSLNGNSSLDDLYKTHARQLSSEEVFSFVEYLQEENVILNGQLNSQYYSGINTIQLLSNLFFNVLTQHMASKDSFSEAFHKGTLPKQCVEGFAVQHYHITHLCESSISNACSLAHSPEHKALALGFLLDEHQHYKMMENALKSLDFSNTEIEKDVPLPATQAHMDMLFSLSKKDFVGYASVLFMYEGDLESSLKHQEAISSYGFDEEFTKPQINHEQINQIGDHFSSSKDILEKIDFLTQDDYKRLVLLVKRVAFNKLCMLNQIQSYYQSSSLKSRILFTQRSPTPILREAEKAFRESFTDECVNLEFDLQKVYHAFLSELLDSLASIISQTSQETSRAFTILLNRLMKDHQFKEMELDENSYFCLLNLTDYLYRISHFSKEDFLILCLFTYRVIWSQHEDSLPITKKHEETILKTLDRLHISENNIQNTAHLIQATEHLVLLKLQLSGNNIHLGELSFHRVFKKLSDAS